MQRSVGESLPAGYGEELGFGAAGAGALAPGLAVGVCGAGAAGVAAAGAADPAGIAGVPDAPGAGVPAEVEALAVGTGLGGIVGRPCGSGCGRIGAGV